MWTVAGALLLVSCCLWSAEAQSDRMRRQSIWNKPIEFKTKAKDNCSMIITGHGDYTRLRLSCQGIARSYWCEYLGTPRVCRSYNKNPRHYFVQMMWGFRKLQNACQGPRQIKPHMCKRWTDDSAMVFTSRSFSRPRQAAQAGPAPTRPSSARQDSTKTARVPPKTTPTPSPESTSRPVESTGKRLARRHCWRSLQGLCTYVIGLFRN